MPYNIKVINPLLMETIGLNETNYCNQKPVAIEFTFEEHELVKNIIIHAMDSVDILGICVYDLPEERLKEQDSKEFFAMTQDERIAYNEAYLAQTWYYPDVDRHDPVLVQVVEELGDKASGQFAKLRIAEVSGAYRITEYDGYESVETPSSYDWVTP